MSPVLNKALDKCIVLFPSCTNFDTKSYNGGSCGVGDAELDYQRYITARTFSVALMGMSQNLQCFDYLQFRKVVSDVVVPNAVAYAGQGLGVYEGLDHIAEYFSLLSPRVNKGFLYVSPKEHGARTLVVSPSGSNLTFGMQVVNVYANNTYKRNSADYLETIFTFNGCNLKAQTVYVPPVSTIYQNTVTGVGSLSEMLYKTVNIDTFQTTNDKLPLLGIAGICRQHTKYCTGTNAQFASYDECMTYYKTLPRFSPACGKESLLSGDSVVCRAKHQFMVQISSRVHCPHLGRKSTPCDDTKCFYPGPSTAVDVTNWSSDLVTKMNDYANGLSLQVTQNSWKYADYCNYLNHFVSWNKASTSTSVTSLIVFDDFKIWAIDTLSKLYRCSDGSACQYTDMGWPSMLYFVGVKMDSGSKLICASFGFLSLKCTVGDNPKVLSNWIEVPSKPKIAVNRDGALWGLDYDLKVFYRPSYNSQSWIQLSPGSTSLLTISSVLTNFGQRIVCGVDVTTVGYCANYDGSSSTLDFFPVGYSLSELVVAGDGTLYSRSRSGVISFCNDYFNCMWIPIPGISLTNLAASPGKICGLDSTKQIFCSLANRYVTNENWQKVYSRTSLVDAALFSDLSIWAADATDSVFNCPHFSTCQYETVKFDIENLSGVLMFNGAKLICSNSKASSTTKCNASVNPTGSSTWKTLEKYMAKVSPNKDGSIYGIDSAGDVFYRSSIDSNWISIYMSGTRFKQISTAHGEPTVGIPGIPGIFCGIAIDNNTYCASFSKSAILPLGLRSTTAIEIAVAENGYLFAKDANGKLSYCNNFSKCQWQVMPGPVGITLTKIMAVSGKFCGLTANSEIHCRVLPQNF